MQESEQIEQQDELMQMLRDQAYRHAYITNLRVTMAAALICGALKYGYRNPTGFRRWVKVAKNQKLLYTHGMGTWKSKNRHKYLLQYHIIFVCKYRKKLLVSRQISDDIKQFSYEICQRHSVIIRYMETDKDHIQKSRLRKKVTVDVKGI